jgi:hypothetical protein
MTRIDRAIAAGWTVVRVRARGLFLEPAETVHRVQDALFPTDPSSMGH